MLFEDESFSQEPFNDIELIGHQFKIFLRREVGADIRSLKEAPPIALNFFFKRDEFETGDMVADESGDLWTYINEDGCSYLISSNPLEKDDHLILYII